MQRTGTACVIGWLGLLLTDLFKFLATTTSGLSVCLAPCPPAFGLRLDLRKTHGQSALEPRTAAIN